MDGKDNTPRHQFLRLKLEIYEKKSDILWDDQIKILQEINWEILGDKVTNLQKNLKNKKKNSEKYFLGEIMLRSIPRRTSKFPRLKS